MKKSRSSVYIITIIYAATLLLTVFSFLGLGFSESLIRFVVSLLAVLVAESVVYGYCIFLLRATGRMQKTSPVVISGAFIAGIYMVSVVISAIIFDWLLELSPMWYAALQLLILLGSLVILAGIGLYGRNAEIQEHKIQKSIQGFQRHRQELAKISALAGTWKNSEVEQLVQQLKLLEDKFKFSDPVSAPSLYATEDMLDQQISLLHDHVELLLAVSEPHESWKSEMNEIMESISRTLLRRNRELTSLK